jgi:flagellar basal body-associated protein FliL
MEKKEVAKKSSSVVGIAVAVVGIVLIIAGVAYALYRRYVIGHTSLTRLASNPIVDALGIIGVILLIVGVALYYRMKTPKSSATTATEDVTRTKQK